MPGSPQEASHLQDIDDFSLKEWIKPSSDDEDDNDLVGDLNCVTNERSTSPVDEVASANNDLVDDPNLMASDTERSTSTGDKVASADNNLVDDPNCTASDTERSTSPGDKVARADNNLVDDPNCMASDTERFTSPGDEIASADNNLVDDPNCMASETERSTSSVDEVASADNYLVGDLNSGGSESQRSTSSGDEVASADNAWMNDPSYEASGGEESFASSGHDVQVYSPAIHHDTAFLAKLCLKIKVARNTAINESIMGDHGLGLCRRPPPVVCQERGDEKDVCINRHTPAGEEPVNIAQRRRTNRIMSGQINFNDRQTLRTFTYRGQDIPDFGNNFSIDDTVHMIVPSGAPYSSLRYEPLLFPTSLANPGPENVYSGPNRLFNADDAYSFGPMSQDVDQNSGSNSHQGFDELEENFDNE